MWKFFGSQLKIYDNQDFLWVFNNILAYVLQVITGNYEVAVDYRSNSSGPASGCSTEDASQ